MSWPQPHRDRGIEIDEMPPLIDLVTCPPAVPGETTFVWCFTIHAHDEAGFARVVTPPEALEYTYVFAPPPPLSPIYPAVEWSRFNRTLEVWLDGRSHPGECTFSCRARDLAGNVSCEWVCRFIVGE
jgi:hypothetical protein